jgi:hypothetical protein
MFKWLRFTGNPGSRQGTPESRADVVLKRIEMTDQGTFGHLIIPGKGQFCFTGELPWRNNASNVSSIPAGVYEVRWTLSPRFKVMMYEVMGVTGRAGIRIHSANLMGNKDKGYKSHLNGCIAYGERLGVIEGQKALLVSKPAHRRFETLMDGKTFTLEVQDAY